MARRKRNYVEMNSVGRFRTDGPRGPRTFNPTHWIALGLSVILLIVSFVSWQMASRRFSEQLAQQNTEIAGLSSRIEAQKAANQQKESVSVYEITGLDRARVETDKGIAVRFMQDVMGWNSYASYMEKRDAVMSKYGLRETDDFMKVFFPRVTNLHSDVSGDDYNMIDSGSMNISFRDLDGWCIGIEPDGTYSYLFWVRFSSTSMQYGYSATDVMALTCSIDSHGNIFGITAHILR